MTFHNPTAVDGKTEAKSVGPRLTTRGGHGNSFLILVNEKGSPGFRVPRVGRMRSSLPQDLWGWSDPCQELAESLSAVAVLPLFFWRQFRKSFLNGGKIK